MTFPLSKEEQDFLDSVDKILENHNSVRFTPYEITRYSELISLMVIRNVLINTSSFDGFDYTLIGSFRAFQDYIKSEEKKYIVGNENVKTNSEFIQVCSLIKNKLRKMIHNVPEKEVEIQDAIENIFIMNDWQKGVDYDRESGKVEFSVKEYIPDFVFTKINMCVEVKLVREGKTSKIVEEIGSDISGYSVKYNKILFVIYDLGNIRDVDQFTNDIEKSRNDLNIKVIIIKH